MSLILSSFMYTVLFFLQLCSDLSAKNMTGKYFCQDSVEAEVSEAGIFESTTPVASEDNTDVDDKERASEIASEKPEGTIPGNCVKEVTKERKLTKSTKIIFHDFVL
jgi:hypothetical protein